jgi:hypothetical protein
MIFSNLNQPLGRNLSAAHTHSTCAACHSPTTEPNGTGPVRPSASEVGLWDVAPPMHSACRAWRALRVRAVAWLAAAHRRPDCSRTQAYTTWRRLAWHGPKRRVWTDHDEVHTVRSAWRRCTVWHSQRWPAIGRLAGRCSRGASMDRDTLIVCMTQDQLFHTYDQKCSQITKYHKYRV